MAWAAAALACFNHYIPPNAVLAISANVISSHCGGIASACHPSVFTHPVPFMWRKVWPKGTGKVWHELPEQGPIQRCVNVLTRLQGVARAARKSGATPPGAHANSDSSGSGNIGSSDSSMKDTSNPRGASLRTEGSSGSIPADILTGSHNHHHHHHHQHHANHYHHSPGASRPAPGRAQPVSGVVGAAEAEGADAEEGPLPPPPLKHPPSSGLLAAEDE
eukprot:scaffold154783_cov17-Tisochrysis_lutea.AAC.4